ncbi:hypothetical protein JGU66_12380 [Myxococcaceae bacterium JPH2]|nr:hypothetical protein [Myxococcaceae bacterium JPH2]
MGRVQGVSSGSSASGAGAQAAAERAAEEARRAAEAARRAAEAAARAAEAARRAAEAARQQQQVAQKSVTDAQKATLKPGLTPGQAQQSKTALDAAGQKLKQATDRVAAADVKVRDTAKKAETAALKANTLATQTNAKPPFSRQDLQRIKTGLGEDAATFDGPPVGSEFRKRFGPQEGPQAANSTEATSLLTEDARDGKANCLDVAADWIDKSSPELRGRAEMVFLKDQRAGAEGDSGHVVVKQGDKVFDPTSQKSYDSLDSYLKEQPQYQEAGRLPAKDVKSILDAPPGSPERQAAITKAGVPPELQRMMVADNANLPRNQPVNPSDLPKQEPTPNQPLNPKSVAEANDYYDKLIKKAPVTNRDTDIRGKFFGVIEEKKNDPDFIAQFVKRLKDDKELDGIVAPKGSSFFDTKENGEYTLTTKDGEKTREQILGALKSARDKGYLGDQDLRDLAGTNPTWKNIGARLGVERLGTDPAHAGPINEIKSKTGEVTKANDAVKEKNTELQRQLARVGPGLTSEQKQKYIEAYRNDPKNKAVYDTADQKKRELAETLQKPANAAVLARASIQDPAARQAIYDAMKEVAHSPDPKVAVDFAKQVQKDPELKKAFGTQPDFEKDITAPAVQNLAGKYIAANPGEPKKAYEQYKEDIKGLVDSYAKPGVETKGSAADGQQAWADLDGAADGDPDKLKSLTEDWDNASPTTRALRGGAVAFYAAWGKDKLDNQAYADGIKDLATAGEQGLELAAGATQSLVNAGKLGSKGATFAKLAAELSPALGVVANAASLASHTQKTAETKNPAYAVAAFGDAIAVLGSVAQTLPGGAVAGSLTRGFGEAFSGVAELVGNGIEDIKKNDDIKKYLQAALPNDKNYQEQLLHGDSHQLANLTKDMGLSPEQIQDLSKQLPLVRGEGQDNALPILAQRLKYGGVTGEQAAGLLKAVAQSDPKDPKGALRRLLTPLNLDSSSQPIRNRQELIDNLSRYTNGNPAAQAAVDYLKSLPVERPR